MNTFIKTFRILAMALALTGLSTYAFTSCESFDDSELQSAIKDLQNRVTALEKKVAENVSALQSMVSLGSVAKCEYDAATGKTVITLLDGKQITIDQTVKGTSLVTVVEKDGEYFWGLCKDGKTELLVINGKNVPVEVKPDAKLSDNGEWLISADGGKTWVSTGIFHENSDGDSDNDTDVVFFKDVKIEGDILYITLADGQTITLDIIGEASFSASETSLWFTRLAEVKMVNLSMKNVKAFTITEKPEGWIAVISDEILHITSPDIMEGAETSGTIKILAVFNSNVNPEIVSVDVHYEQEFTLEADKYGTVKVKVSEHVAEDYQGYIINAWKVSDFTADAAIEWLNTTGYESIPYNGSKEFNISEITENFIDSEPYVIFATSYIPSRLIMSGDKTYELNNLLTAEYRPTTAQLSISDIRYDYAYLKATFIDIPKYYAGIADAANWNNFIMNDILEMLSYDSLTALESQVYEGSAANFPDGEQNIKIKPDTEYLIWVVPQKEDGKYTEEDFITKTFTTSSLYKNSSVSAPTHKITEVTFGGFIAEVTPATGAYKTYATILPAASIPEDESELVITVVGANKYSEDNKTLTVSANNYKSDDEVYLISVSIGKDGGYGSVNKELVPLKQLEYTDETCISGSKVTYGLGDIALALEFKGTPATITYYVSTFSLYPDNVMEEMMAMSQYGDEIDLPISKLTNGNKLYFDNLEIGMNYTFYAVVKDAQGNPSHMYTTTFIPSMNVDYVLPDAEDYTFGMPEISGTWINGTTYKLNIGKPDTCIKFWISVCDSDYLGGDIWSNTDNLITLNLYKAEEHTESISGKVYEFLNSTTRVYMAWLDDKGEYHAIHEFDPHN